MKFYLSIFLLLWMIALPVMAQSETLQRTRPNDSVCRDFDTAIPAYEDPLFWIKSAEVRLSNGDYAWVVENMRFDAEEGIDPGYPSFLYACGLWGLGRDGSAEDRFLQAIELAEDDELITMVISLIGYDPGEREFRPMVDAPQTIDVSGDPDSILKQLETSNLIPSGSSLIVDLASVSLTTAGINFDTYGMEADANNFVMGATIDFQPDAPVLELCNIGGRITRDSSSRITGFSNSGFSSQTTISLPDFLMVGVDSEGTLILIENAATLEEPYVVLADETVDIDSPLQLTIVVLDNILNAYANGDLVFTTELEHQRGGWAFILQSAANNTRCVASNFFAYQIPDHYIFGRCDILAFGTVNRRSGPGTNFDRAGQMATGDVIEAIGQAQDTTGFTWWQLEDDAWVREDVVVAEGDCRSLTVEEA